MLSIIVYGRNDNHGYNLHKRAAVSINCLAEILRDPADELIFVDYKSPDAARCCRRSRLRRHWGLEPRLLVRGCAASLGRTEDPRCWNSFAAAGTARL